MKIIDIHSHFNIGSQFDTKESVYHQRNFDFIMQDYKNANILAGGFCPFSSVEQSVLSHQNIYNDNENMHNIALSNEKVYQWLVLHPERKELFGQVERLILSDKVLGVKLHSHYHGYSIEEYGDKLFSFCNELKCFVLIHPKPNTTPTIVKLADKYPNLKVIIAHLGHDYFSGAVQTEDRIEAILQSKHGNIFTDVSAHGITLNNIVEYAVEKVGSEKLFFGTDTYSCGYQVGRIEYSRISDKDKENIFYNNAKTHFARQFKNL